MTDAQALAEAVLGVDGVVGLTAGPLGQFRSYLPGGATVPGVRSSDDEVRIDVVCRYGPELTGLATAIDDALGDLRGDRAVVVTVAGVVLPDEPDPVRADSVVEPPAPQAHP